MKKIRNCKVILALAICLTMFAGLAMTASAFPYLPSCPKCNKVMGYVGKVDHYCYTCMKKQTVDKFICKDYASAPSCKGVKYYCPFHSGYFNG